MSQAPQEPVNPATQPAERKVASKDNAGVKHRVMGDRTRSAAAKGRASLGAAVTPTLDDGPLTHAVDMPQANSEANTEESPRTGEKRVRSDSNSSLSADMPPKPITAEKTKTAGIEGQPSGPPQVTPDAQDANTSNPAAAPPVHDPTETTDEGTNTWPGSPSGQDAPMLDDPVDFLDPFDAPPPTTPRDPLTPSYRRPAADGSVTPPHRFEPTVHPFHLDTPEFVPSSNRATEVTMLRLRALRSQRTTKCDPRNALTKMVPTPRHGWPRVYPATPDFLYTNIPDSTLQKWLAADHNGEKLIVQVMKQNSWCSPQCDTTANLLVRTIEAIFGLEKVKVATASEDTRGRSQQNAPFSFLVFGLTTDAAAKMVAKHCFATELIQFLVYPLVYAATPSYLGSLMGLRNIGDDPADVAILRDDITEIMLGSHRMYQSLLEYAEDVTLSAGDDAIMDRDAAVTRVLSKLSIGIIDTKVSGGFEEPTINLYLELPASRELDHAFPSFIENAMYTSFDTPLMGTGRFTTGFSCNNCRGITHPTGLCPFEAVDDWVTITQPRKDDPAPAPGLSRPSAVPTSPRAAGSSSRRDAYTNAPRISAPSFRGTRGRTNGRV